MCEEGGRRKKGEEEEEKERREREGNNHSFLSAMAQKKWPLPFLCCKFE
jgi:hypothetical protein